ncbi:hypothetical protein FA95DRAFT_1410110 [Auriscalpium vulgare]|uniref:Uncharacterized protein n=1 Tax=Auriscalpium vulgare TaxID=40419 RepID=A0ACB8RQP3_9AGAM|nr:hypothetical protein FA95DRAFT_1410110 [Auriscalpium vulgare]
MRPNYQNGKEKGLEIGVAARVRLASYPSDPHAIRTLSPSFPLAFPSPSHPKLPLNFHPPKPRSSCRLKPNRAPCPCQSSPRSRRLHSRLPHSTPHLRRLPTSHPSCLLKPSLSPQYRWPRPPLSSMGVPRCSHHRRRYPRSTRMHRMTSMRMSTHSSSKRSKAKTGYLS